MDNLFELHAILFFFLSSLTTVTSMEKRISPWETYEKFHQALPIYVSFLTRGGFSLPKVETYAKRNLINLLR
jgi:hypothetical protein